MNDEEIQRANRLMILFDNIRKMDDTEIVVFIHNLAHYLYDRTKGELYLIEGKEIKRLENSQVRIDKAIEHIEHELNGHILLNDEITWNEEYYTNGKLDYRKLLISLLQQTLDILKGSDKDE